jgi:hypothetical protein
MKNNVRHFYVPKWSAPCTYVIVSCGLYFSGSDHFSIAISVTVDVPL